MATLTGLLHRYEIEVHVEPGAARRLGLPDLPGAWDNADLGIAIQEGAATVLEVRRYSAAEPRPGAGQGDLGNVKAGGGPQA